jgi:hypothetical protein
MRKASLLFLALAVVLLLVTPLLAQGPIKLSGTHYNLNIIGLAKCSNHQEWSGDCFSGNAGDIQTNGHTIFVPLKTQWMEDPCLTEGDSGYADPADVQVAELLKGVRILVSDGSDMQVTDRDATDGTAKFVIPDGSYLVYARALGKPGGCLDMDTIICNEETSPGVFEQVSCDPNLTNDQYVVVGHIDVDRIKGTKPHWDDVTNDLLPAVTGVGVGDPSYLDFFWQIFNNNLRLVQLRFYLIVE